MKRLILQNPDDLPDYILAMVILQNLPRTGIAVYNTPLGDINVFVVERRKSRVFTVYRNHLHEDKPRKSQQIEDNTLKLFDNV